MAIRRQVVNRFKRLLIHYGGNHMEKVIYEKQNRIGYITLNRPDELNALDDHLNTELWDVWKDSSANASGNVFANIESGGFFPFR